MAILIIAFYALVLVTAIVCVQIRAHRLGASEWEQQVGRLKAVRVQGLRTIAAQCMDGTENGPCRHASEAIRLLGGREGLDRLESNARVLVSLASYVNVWSVEDGFAEFQEMRMNMRTLSWRIAELKMRLLCQPNGRRTYATLEIVAASYCQMVTSLLSVYSLTHVARRDRLIAACNW